MKKAIAAGAIAGLALAGAGAGVANATYPPSTTQCTLSASTAAVGSPITFTCGIGIGFTPGSSVAWSSATTGAGGVAGGAAVFGLVGPSTTAVADANGQSTVSLAFSEPGTYEVKASGSNANGPVTGSVSVTITGGGKPTPHPTSTGGGATGGGSQAGGTTGGGLAQTGGNNTLTIAAVGAGLLLAGVGAVVVARRRESSNA